MKVIKEVLALVFRFSGILLFIRGVFCRNKVTIIFYHDPKPEVFRKHIDYLYKRYNFISLEILVEAIYQNDFKNLPPKSLVITIDDGNKGNYDLLDLFKKYKIKPTIYLCSHIINTHRKFWFLLGNKNLKVLKKLRNKQRLKILKERYDYELHKEYPDRQALNLMEIKEMSPYVDFQCHTKFHPILTTCDDEGSQEEIMESKFFLEKLLGKKVNYFSYPNGDYGEREVRILKDCDYKSARTYDIGWNSIDSDPYRLKAMAVDDNASINMLSAQIFGFFRYFNYLIHGRYNGKHPSYV